MIVYVVLYSARFDAAMKFYDDVLSRCGAVRCRESADAVGWATAENSTVLVVRRALSGMAPVVGDGSLFGIAVERENQVRAAHQTALKLGALNEADPALDARLNVYIASCRDLDGYRFSVLCPVGHG
jgi:hypothetical protein